MTAFDERHQGLKDAKIMIVDDEPLILMWCKRFLKRKNTAILLPLTTRPKQCKLLRETRPDLLLLDLIMPEVSGFDILSAVRAHPKFKYLPVIILTASTDTPK